MIVYYPPSHCSLSDLGAIVQKPLFQAGLQHGASLENSSFKACI
jgi:hypothetical protein